MNKLINLINGDVETLIKILGAKKLFILEDEEAHEFQEMYGMEAWDRNDRRFACNLSWQTVESPFDCLDLDSKNEPFFMACDNGDTKEEAILNCIRIFFESWKKGGACFSDEMKQQIIEQGFDKDLLKDIEELSVLN